MEDGGGSSESLAGQIVTELMGSAAQGTGWRYQPPFDAQNSLHKVGKISHFDRDKSVLRSHHVRWSDMAPREIIMA